MKRLFVLLILPLLLPSLLGATGLTFTEKIRAQAGLVRYHTFVSSDESSAFGNDIASFTNVGQTNAVAPVLDTSVKFSGQNSLKFTIPSQSSSGASGQWGMRFASDDSVQFGAGQTFYVQWQMRFSREHFEHLYDVCYPDCITGYSPGSAHPGGWKLGIIGQGDGAGCSAGNTTPCATTCSNMEIVPQNTGQWAVIRMYNSCATFAPFETNAGGSDIDWEPRKPQPPTAGTFCNRTLVQAGNRSNCLAFKDGLVNPTDTYTKKFTFSAQVRLGATDGSHFVGSNVKAWGYWEGDASAFQIFDYDVDLVQDGANKYGRVWLLPYHSYKDDREVHSVAYVWYANVIVATQPIPLETSEVTDTGTLATAALAMPARSWVEVPYNSTKSVILQGQIEGNVLPYAMKMEWCEGMGILVAGDHGNEGPNEMSPGTFRYDASSNNWTQLQDTGHDNPTIIGQHEWNKNAYDCVRKILYINSAGVGTTNFDIYGAPLATGLMALLNNSKRDDFVQVSVAMAWWSGLLTTGGADGSVVTYNSAFSGTVNTYRPLTNDFAADLGVGIGSDTYHGFMAYSPRNNVAIFGGGNANPNLMMRLNANHTLTHLCDSPVGLGIQHFNVVNEPVTGHFLLMGNGQLYLFDETGAGSGCTGTYTLLNTAGDAVPSAYVGDPIAVPHGDTISHPVPELGVVCYTTAITSSDLRRGCYKYVESIAEGAIDNQGGGGVVGGSGRKRMRR